MLRFYEVTQHVVAWSGLLWALYSVADQVFGWQMFGFEPDVLWPVVTAGSVWILLDVSKRKLIRKDAAAFEAERKT